MENAEAIVSFRKPPVVEVVCGVQFAGLSLGGPHLGLFWQRIRSAYPTFRQAPPLPQTIEQADGPVIPAASVEVDLGTTPRALFTSADGGQLLQLQADRLHHNWQRSTEADVYPRFREVRSQFLARWGELCAFASEEGLLSPQPIQYELTYLNHVPQGDLWNAEQGLTTLFPWLTPHASAFRAASDIECRLHYPLDVCRGRLHVSVRTAYRLADFAPVVVMDLTVRGAPEKQGSSHDLEAWLGEAREAIVQTFADLTGPKAHAAWEREK